MKDATRNWLEFAKRDIVAAETILGDEYLSNIVLFHSQQAVEKVFKALLEEYLIDVPRIHNLYKLSQIFPEEVKSILNFNQDDLTKIDLIYIDTRYPADNGLLPSGFPTKEEAKQYFKICKNIFSIASSFLKAK